MLPLINGKEFLSCTEDDFSILIDNPDYRECDYIDYKQTFSFLEIGKGNEREHKKVEYKCDVCSFANADGGYLIYGIADENGCASSLIGIDIPDDNTDKFELERRNDLGGIQPKIPNVEFGFIKLKNGKFIVVIKVLRDGFAPYYYLENEKYYRIYKRSGNRKTTVAYSELRQLFNQSLSLEKSVREYVADRIDYYRFSDELVGDKFVHLAIIPENFMDTNYKKNVFLLERKNNIAFSFIFSSINCSNLSIPCVDGIRFTPAVKELDYADCYVKNSGIAEMCLSLEKHVERNNFLPWEWLWQKINDICIKYIDTFKTIRPSERCFFSLSLIGCKDVDTENDNFLSDYVGRIDRDVIICDPIVINTNVTDSEKCTLLKKMKLAFLLAIGVKYSKELIKLIDELYGNNHLEE